MREITEKCLSMVLCARRRRFCEWIFNFAPAQTRTHTPSVERSDRATGKNEKPVPKHTRSRMAYSPSPIANNNISNDLCADWPSARTIGIMPNMFGFVGVYFAKINSDRKVHICARTTAIRPHLTYPKYLSDHFQIIKNGMEMHSSHCSLLHCGRRAYIFNWSNFGSLPTISKCVCLSHTITLTAPIGEHVLHTGYASAYIYKSWFIWMPLRGTLREIGTRGQRHWLPGYVRSGVSV